MARRASKKLMVKNGNNLMALACCYLKRQNLTNHTESDPLSN